MRGELEGVREQVLQHLLQALGIGDDAAAEVRIELDVERRAARLSASWRNGRATVSSRLAKQISSASTVTVPDSIFDRSRMSLIRFSRSVPAPWMVRANSTCLRRQVAVGVVAELLAEDQDAVERRAQLVRHVGEELGLVLRGERQLGRLLLERAARLLDLLVLALDLDVALGELLRLLLELLVGLLQLLCCVCSSPASCCDCFSRPSVCIVASMLLSTMPMLVGELLEERQLQRR